MERICVQRKVEVWIEDFYRVEEINDEIVESAINCDLDPDDSDVIWETEIDLGPVEVYDEHQNKIYSNIEDE